MDVYGVRRVQGVSAAEGARDGNPARPALCEDVGIAPLQAFLRELERSELIPRVRVRPRLVHHQVGLVLIEHLGDVFFEVGEVLILSGEVVEADVDVASLLLRIDVLLVDGEGEHRLLAPEDDGGAVSLVQVAVDNGCSFDGAPLS